MSEATATGLPMQISPSNGSNSVLLKELAEIDSLLGKMITDYQNYRTTLLSTFAVSFAIPLSPITAQANHLSSHWLLASVVFALWALGVILMGIAFNILMERVHVREQLGLATSKFDLLLAKAWADPDEMRESRNRALERMRQEKQGLEDKLNRLVRGRLVVIAALILFMVCVGIELFSFLLCKQFFCVAARST